MIVDGLLRARGSCLHPRSRSAIRKWSQKSISNNVWVFCEISMNVYCGIQLKLVSSLVFRLHNVQLAQVSYKEQCHSKGREHSFFKCWKDQGQGHGPLQGMVTDPTRHGIKLVVTSLLYSLQFVIQYLKLGRQRKITSGLSLLASLVINDFHLVEQERIAFTAFSLSRKKWESPGKAKTSFTTLPPYWSSLWRNRFYLFLAV